MSDIRPELRYAASHEWIRLEDDGTAYVGISDHAQDAMGDLVFVELPEVGQKLETGDEAGVVESVKAASDIYAPVSGEIVAVNDALEDTPELVNQDPYGDGWLFRLRINDKADLDELLSADEYREQLESED
ncbi:glycine cleavage system H protein [Isoalcanivorax pacificus W11-5]|uniref:Glycine cleavage system H protein n=1 Tax=Isoalcanivorax pacificus W11-5 TaxID=391936 RepID=A0A0B4XF29_9GAMM|nr:glycine cleavage system protein GcvH [Isoalcanivorax pacificus]AJD46629.1 glycine cleavage system H protein [Isoalcanivorax pacificus W11-5]